MAYEVIEPISHEAIYRASPQTRPKLVIYMAICIGRNKDASILAAASQSEDRFSTAFASKSARCG